MKRTATMFLAAIAATTLGMEAWGADLAAGEQKAKQICAACHGLDGNSQVADFPKIGGQYPDYLVKTLRDYKSGRRKNPIMMGMAAPLTNADIDNVAAYYAAQPAAVQAGRIK
ncbi:MAG: cytochrome c [Pseudomonadota bacterium]|nr:cytochrome c [Pseudomonadota bacterium]